MSPRQDAQPELPEGWTYGDLVRVLVPDPVPLPDMRFKFTEDVDTDGGDWHEANQDDT